MTTEANETAYDELIVSLQASTSQLSLLLAVCDDNTLRDTVIQRYTDELSETRHFCVPLLRGEPSLTQTIRQTLLEADGFGNAKETLVFQSDTPVVVTITGTEKLETTPGSAKRSEQAIFLGYLQWTREAMQRFHFPIVLWVTNDLLRQIALHAPDFWSWRRGTFDFTQE